MGRAFEYLTDLMRQPHRGTGTPEERRAAERLAHWLERMGYAVAIQPFRAPRDTLYLGPGITMLLLVAAGAVHSFLPLTAMMLGIIALCPLVGELLGSRLNLDAILPKRPSQNVVARRVQCGAARLRLVLSAHYDTQRESPLFHPRFLPYLQAFFTMNYVLLFALAASLMIGYFTAGFSIPIYLLSALLLCIGLFFLWCAWAGDHVPGANDNGSGVAVVLSLAERFAEELPKDVDLVILLTGAEEVGMRGMKRFLEDGHLEPAMTRFVVLDNIGAGKLHYMKGEGMLSYCRYDPQLIAAGKRLATGLSIPLEGKKNLLLPTDGAVPARLGYPTLTLLGFDDRGFLPHYHTAEDTLEHVDPDALANAEELIAALVLELADQPLPGRQNLASPTMAHHRGP